MTAKQQIDQARADRDGALCIAALAVSLLTPDQRERLRDQLVCLHMEDGL